MGQVKEGSSALYVAPHALRVGMYVHLDLSWMQHPFPTASFKVKDTSQIERIRSLGLARVRIDAALSDAPHGPDSPAPEVAPTAAAAVPEAPESAARAADHRAVRSACERELSAAARQVKTISRLLHGQPEQAGETASQLVEGLGASLLQEADMAIHLMAESVGGESVYHHALNTALLAMLLARQMKAPAQAIQVIGLGALLHDIGKFEIPERLWRKSEPLTRAEQNWVQQHGGYGVELARKMKMPPEVLLVIAQHHERADGQGYPKKLQGDQISLLARIVSVANTYDNLCNPSHRSLSLTPHEALAMMYGARSKEFDPTVLQTFVRCLGIYPPGTLVGLSDGTLGIVLTVNTAQALRPVVMLYDAGLPRGQAPLRDLAEPGAPTIVKTLRPDELGVEVYDYLAPRARTTYFFHAPRAGAAA